ncbi:translation initiation factor IF-2-like isoform X2 [Dermacentor silvarum]|uniref:translation initiation factor IF-2-like isoform X2 n=1 Tax=Dermacentor silvarum TaxID=543639 RepID=UPI0021016268|nr:translation initiation factor IF-2-like isoform X2 [Dermacentor silvarum]
MTRQRGGPRRRNASWLWTPRSCRRKHLLQIGGKSLCEVASYVMKAVMAHPVQVLHSRKGKRAFINLKLCRIVTDVICAKGGGGDLTQAQDFIKRLPGSVDSGGGRKRRFTETFAAEQPDGPSLQGRNHCLPTAALSLPHPCPQVPGKSTVGPSCPAAAAPAPSPAAAPAPPPAAAPGAEHPY